MTSFPVVSRGGPLPDRRQSRHRQDHHRAAIPDGRRPQGERGLYITLSETKTSCARRRLARLDARRRIDVFELVPPESLLDPDQQQSLLYSSDLELGETTKRIFEAFERVKPTRVVLDSLSEIRLLAQSSLRYRRQILALKHYFARQRRDRAAARRPHERGQ